MNSHNNDNFNNSETTQNMKNITSRSFDQIKKNIFFRKDRSNEGHIDEYIKNFILELNSFKSIYTTSSCSGRTIVIAIHKSLKKNLSKFIYKNHDFIEYDDLLNSIINSEFLNKDDYELWLKAEPFILHIVCKNLFIADSILKVARNLGFKRSGIISLQPRIVIEILGTDNFAIPIKNIIKNIKKEIDKSKKEINRSFLEDYLKYIIDLANENLKRVHKKIDVFRDKIIKTLNDLEK